MALLLMISMCNYNYIRIKYYSYITNFHMLLFVVVIVFTTNNMHMCVQEVDRCTHFVTETFLRCETYFILTNVTSQTIIYPNPNPNQKKFKFGPQILNHNTIILNIRKGRIFAGLVLGLGIWGPNLNFFWFELGLGYVMVCNVTLVFVKVRSVILIKELARGAERKVSPS